MFEKITVLIPTEEEAVQIRRKALPGVDILISGVGMAETAAAAARVVLKKKPGLVILAGIAGAYPGSGLKAGDCVIAESERICDLGAVRDGVFKPLYHKEYFSPTANGIKCLPAIAGCTVNTGTAGWEHIDNDGTGFKRCGIENMEGAAFFAVCEAAHMPFLEIRAVSNLIDDSRPDWRSDEAVTALADGLEKIITELRNI